MSTAREHYDVTAKALNAEREWILMTEDTRTQVAVRGKISYVQEENAKYWSLYMPSEADIGCIHHILKQKNIRECLLENEPDQIIGFADRPERQRLSSFIFTKVVYLYIEQTIDDNIKEIITEIGDHYGLHIRIRDLKYVNECIKLSKPVAFISHDSRDKDVFVRELAKLLNTLLHPVWYDEFSLNVGDSLRENIERGLKDSKKCILILSPNFLSNNGWGKAEFDSIYTREIIEHKNIILPIWHNVGQREVYAYSPRLADRFGLNSAEGVPALATKLVMAIKGS